MMKILITGGSGFLGRQLSVALLNLGHQIVWLSQNPNQVTPLDNINVIDYHALNTLSTPIDIIINLAGAGIADKRWRNAQKRDCLIAESTPLRRYWIL